MFCSTKKTMLCIKCFRDTSADDRLHCVDIDTAYNQVAVLQNFHSSLMKLPAN